MSKGAWVRSVMLTLSLVGAAIGCSPEGPSGSSDAGPGGGGGGDAGGGGGGGGGAYTCCVNGMFYDCPSMSAFDQCSGGGSSIGDCLAACTPGDFDCMDACFDAIGDPDPSACARDAARDGECTTSSCSNPSLGTSCDSDLDCDSRNCTDGRCYDNSVGSRCESDLDCDSRNCTDGCCAGNGGGEVCESDLDCDSRNCYQGRCEGNGAGAGCESDLDCDSRNCTSNRCQ
ncbi:MAG: hypothetical protein AB7S26_29690 [Sandaracinaceae bacterium]